MYFKRGEMNECFRVFRAFSESNQVRIDVHAYNKLRKPNKIYLAANTFLEIEFH